VNGEVEKSASPPCTRCPVLRALRRVGCKPSPGTAVALVVAFASASAFLFVIPEGSAVVFLPTATTKRVPHPSRRLRWVGYKPSASHSRCPRLQGERTSGGFQRLLKSPFRLRARIYPCRKCFPCNPALAAGVCFSVHPNIFSTLSAQRLKQPRSGHHSAEGGAKRLILLPLLAPLFFICRFPPKNRMSSP